MELFGLVLLIVVSVLVGWGFKTYILNKETDHLNTPLKLYLLRQIREKRIDGFSYHQCIQYLQKNGISKGEAAAMMTTIEPGEPPDLDNPRTLSWNKWTCEYPGNWKDQKADGDFPKHVAVAITSPGGSGMSFYNHPDLRFEDMVAAQKKLLSSIRCFDIHNWGSFHGIGIKLNGIQVSYNIPMEVMVFEISGGESLILRQVTRVNEEPAVGLAFDLIESSFREQVQN